MNTQYYRTLVETGVGQWGGGSLEEAVKNTNFTSKTQHLSLSLTFNLSRTQSIKDHILFTARGGSVELFSVDKIASDYIAVLFISIGNKNSKIKLEQVMYFVTETQQQ